MALGTKIRLFVLAVCFTASPSFALNSWSFTVPSASSGSFSASESVNSVTVNGDYSRLSNGFISLDVTSSSGTNAPDAGWGTWGIELPGFAFFSRPFLKNEAAIIASVSLGVCPTNTWTGLLTYYIWSGTTGTTKDVSLSTTPVMGVFSWDPIANQATISDLRNLTSYATLSGFSSFNISGTCSNGVITFSGTGDRGGSLYITSDYGAIYATQTQRAMFIVPQATIPAASNLNGTYSVWRMDDTYPMVIDPIRMTISGGTGGSGDVRSDIDADTADTTKTWAMSSISINSPVNGSFTASVSLEGSSTKNCICSVYFRTRTIMVCAFENPVSATKGNNFIMVSDAQAFASGGLDSYLFDSDGKVNNDFGGANATDRILALAIQPDGKLVGGGYTVNSTDDFALMRFLPSGALDTNFDGDGKVQTSFSGTVTDRIQAVALQGDGKIVVAGYYSPSNDDFALARYSSAGVLDNTFDSDGRRTDTFSTGNERWQAVAVQSDNKIVTAGYCRNGGNDDFCVYRYTTAGALDSSWDTDGKKNTNVGGSGTDRGYAVLIQTDGKVVALGRDSNDGGIVRYTTSGAEDSSFSGDGQLQVSISGGNDRFYAAALQSDGKIVACGFATPSSTDFGFARITTAGVLDSTFSSDGLATATFTGSYAGGNEECNGLALQTDGKIVAVGFATATTTDFAVVRLTTDGAIDSTFDSDGRFTSSLSTGTDELNAVVIQSDTKIVGAGYGTNSSGDNDFFVLRLWP